MNVSCTSCSAKYAIPDEKVRGKKVKITCKHCGTGIIVDGTKIAAAADAAPAAAAPPNVAPDPAPAAPLAAAAPTPTALAATPAGTPAAKAASPGPAAKAAGAEELRFDIAYPDDRQETLSVSEIVAKYAAGTLDDEAFIWREGMTDWKAPFDIPELASALTARGLTKKAAAAAAQPFIDDDEATRIQESPFDGLEASQAPAGAWHEPAKEAPSSPEAAFALTPKAGGSSALPFEQPEAAASPKPAVASPKPAAVAAAPAAKAEAPKPAAARRSAARGGGDLFGDLAAAGSEADESLGAEAKDAPKMTGARNESSVLFSLDALVKQEKPAPKKSAPKEDAASILMGDSSGPSSISNLGTGQFGSAFAAPDFTAPVAAAPIAEVRPSDPVEISTAAAPKKKGGMGLWIGLGVLVAAAGAAFATGLPAKLMGAPAAPSATAAAKQEPAPTPAPETPTPTPAPEASAAPSAAPATGGAAAVAPAAAGGAAAVAVKPADPTKPADPVKPADPAKPADIAKPADTAKPAAPASDAPPFDKAAAVAALTAAASSAGSCKTPDGPTGSGKVSITFMPSGRATNTQVSGDLAGTAVGGCVARLFRSAKIPAFSGDAVTVSKSFSVQ
jgi:predicted Zn finger-like uncharacterized protein